MVDYIRSKGGEVHFGTEVTSVFVENNRVTKVETNTQYPKGKVKRCRVCGNIMGAGHVDHCPFCGAHESMLEILTPANSPIKSYTADHIITAMDLPGAKNSSLPILSTNRHISIKLKNFPPRLYYASI